MSDTALLVIDMQVALLEEAYVGKEVIAHINALRDKARSTNTLIIYIQHSAADYEPMNLGAPGWQIHPDIAPHPDDLIIHKLASDAFSQTDLHQELQNRGIQHLIITGMQTEFCVDTTCRAALSQGYNVTLVGDAHTTYDYILSASQTINYHNGILPGVGHPTHFIQVKPTVEAIAELIP